MSPKKFCGNSCSKNAVHDPTLEGSCADEASTLVPTPGFITRATRMPTITEKNAVIANHTRVEIAREAAFVTLRRLATEVTTAAKISGGTMTLRSCT